MNNFLKFVIVFLLLTTVGSFVYGHEIIVGSDVDIHVDIDTEESIFRVNEPISMSLTTEVKLPPSPRTITVGLMDLDDNFFMCNNDTYTNAEDIRYEVCTVEVNATGLYHVHIVVGSETYMVHSIEVKHSRPTSFSVVLLILGLLLIALGLGFTKNIILVVLGGIMFNSGILDNIFTYQYLINPIFIGIIILYILLNVYLLFLLLKET